jgi:large subunit ribosomal protein L32
MGIPAKRRTKQSKRERASHFALRALNLSPCSHCKRLVLPHRVCPHCGYYNGQPVAAVVSRLDAKTAKRHRQHKHTHEEAEEKEGKTKKEKAQAKGG